MTTKTCPKCKIEKELSEFHKNKQTKTGYNCYCKTCRCRKTGITIAKQNLKNKLMKQNIKMCPKCKVNKAFKDFGKEKARAGGISIYCNKCRQIYTHLNRNKNIKRCKKWRSKNREHYLKIKQQYRKTHLIYYATYIKKYHKQRRKNDIKYRITGNLRTRLNTAIKHNYKSTSTKKLLGCTVEFLKNRLESQFTEDMSWDNYGRKEGMKCWEIDHIKPCAKFNLIKAEEQRKCFHYSNLQPLWATDNQKKRDKHIKTPVKLDK